MGAKYGQKVPNINNSHVQEGECVYCVRNGNYRYCESNLNDKGQKKKRSNLGYYERKKKGNEISMSGYVKTAHSRFVPISGGDSDYVNPKCTGKFCRPIYHKDHCDKFC